MIYKIEIYFMIFIIYAFLGWGMECTLGIIKNKKFVNRGFLIGPYCPIYGVGVVSVSLLISRFAGNVIVVFLLSTILCGALEYFTSYAMEKIFNARWWDYSNRKLNINGRVCIETLIPFGIISVLTIYFSNPWILGKLYLIPQNILHYIVAFFAIIYVVDICISSKVIIKFRTITKQARDSSEEMSQKVKEATEVAIQKLKTEKEELLAKLSQQKETKILANFKGRIENIDEIIKNSAKEMSEKIKSGKLNIRKELRERFIKQSKLNKRLINAFPNVEQKDYIHKKKDDNDV